jgi:predicted metallo-beta-lactamase superfamily hydrolase
MSGPIVFVGTYRIPEGKLEEWKQGNREMTEFVEANEPRVIAMHTYINEDGTEATTMHIHPDSESLEFHMEVAAQRINHGIDMLPTGRIDLFGKPSDQLMQQLEQNAESWPVIAKSHVQGFTRPLAG